MQGTVVGCFAKVAARAVFPCVPQVVCDEVVAPRFRGSTSEFIEQHPQHADLLQNSVKKCPHCHKPNAFSLSLCNQCGSSLTDVPVSHTPNVFMGFILGIERTPQFPLTISMRFQSRDLIVMDDLLALAPLHFNCIPTHTHIPDWRYLLECPSRGLEIIDSMLAACHSVANEQFLGHSGWRSRFLRNADSPTLLAEDLALSGFNYPPSQYQLHVQYFFPNFLPFQHLQFLRGVHFTHGRFFPFSYVRECLNALITSSAASRSRFDGARSMEVSEITSLMRGSFGIDYDAAHQSFMSRFRSLSEAHSAWSADDFDGVVLPIPRLECSPDGATCVSSKDTFVAFQSPPVSVLDSNEPTLSALLLSDKLRLQSYGKRTNNDIDTTQLSGTYYAFARDVSCIALPW